MLSFDFLLLLDWTNQYFLDNSLCLFYGLDVLNNKYLIFSGYYDLLSDISESFGVWIALLVLTTSALTLSVFIQQSNNYAVLKIKNVVKSNSAMFVTYRSFLKYVSLNK